VRGRILIALRSATRFAGGGLACVCLINTTSFGSLLLQVSRVKLACIDLVLLVNRILTKSDDGFFGSLGLAVLKDAY